METFANPWAFWLLLLMPALLTLCWLAARARRAVLRRIGSPGLVHALTLLRPDARKLRSTCQITVVLLLVLAICGPQWGRDRSASGYSMGRDLVVALDMSRSMLAEQPGRHTRALRALNDLCDGLENRGGHRVALVIFAARAEAVFPLTHDIGHLRAMLAQLDIESLPAEFRPDAADGLISGTRIGEGIAAAVSVHDSSFIGAQDILLISDGDDPADDYEWKQGIAAAVRRKIPVHTLSVGDPSDAYTIPYQGEWLRHEGQIVKTTVQEKPLQTIAAETGGLFIPGRTDTVPLGKFYREGIEPRGQRQLDPETLTSARPRYAWFLAPAFVLFAASMLISERRRLKRLAPVLAASTALILVSAEPLPREAALIRQANAAFSSGDYKRAVELYTQAAARTDDPGLVSLNKGAALYRLRQYAEAEQHFRRCLDDEEAPPLRRARCFYDLGNSLMQQEHNRPRVEEAIACYRACLQSNVDDAPLRADAAHNLAVAKAVWFKLPAEAPPANAEKKEDGKSKSGDRESADKASMKKDGKQKADGPVQEADIDLKNAAQKLAAGGKLLNLPDDERLTPLSPANTRELLEREMRRMLQSRRDTRQAAAPIAAGVKDW